jgi:hypothetical protein
MGVSFELMQRQALASFPPVLIRREGYWLLCANIHGQPYFEIYRRAA